MSSKKELNKLNRKTKLFKETVFILRVEEKDLLRSRKI